MAVFSVNQARQFYVNTGALAKNQNTAGTGEFRVNNNKLYYISYNVDGEPQRSDIIDLCNIDWANYSSPEAPKAKSFKVSVNPEILDSDSKVPAGYEFVLKVIFTQFIGLSEADRLVKFGNVFTTSAMTPTEFLTALSDSLKKNINKEGQIWPLLEVELDTTGNAPALVLTEVAQEWSRGTLSGELLHFTPHAEKVTIDGIDQDWVVFDNSGSVPYTTATATDGFGNTITNGRKFADLEYFCMGERGDIYRGIGWPNNIETRYMVDPTATYYCLDLQYHYKGDNEDIQHSAKTLTIVGSKANMDTIVAALKELLPEYVDQSHLAISE